MTLGVEKNPGGAVTDADVRRVLLNLLAGGGSAADGAADGEQRVEGSTDVGHTLQNLERKLDALQGLVNRLAEAKEKPTNSTKASYTTAEVAEMLGLQPLTVREWCRLGRVKAHKTHAGRGEDREWRISHEELLRYQNEGLLPLQYTRSGRRVR